jgi:hypothetical protein
VREKSTANGMNVEGQQNDTKGPRTNGELAQPNEHLLKEWLIGAEAVHTAAHTEESRIDRHCEQKELTWREERDIWS